MRISPVISPTTTFGEQNRQANMNAMSEMGRSTKIVFGEVREVHESQNLVKCFDITDGSPVAGNQWVRIDADPDTIVRDWGTIRKGMKVMVILSGPGDGHAVARVIAEKDQKVLGEDAVSNDMNRGLFGIFTPPGIPGGSS